MNNLFSYLKWRGDLLFNNVKFNEVDNVILARVSYFPLEYILSKDDKVTIKEAYQKLVDYGIDKVHVLVKDDLKLFEALANSLRFKDLVLIKMQANVNVEKEEQFAALGILLPNNQMYISYRGTDNTLVGWKEDFNMTFLRKVPAQETAVTYLNTIGKKYFRRKLIIGGHSKGGNLSMYAAMFCNSLVKKRIIAVYNIDGPGFLEEVVESQNYKSIIEKVHTLVPQSSIAGRLLTHEEEYTVVFSHQKGIFQHDVFSWEVEGTTFLHLEELTDGSLLIDKILTEWLRSISEKDREKFVNIIYKVFKDTEVETTDDLVEKWGSTAKIVLETYKSISKEDREQIKKILKAFFPAAKANIKLLHKKEKELKKNNLVNN